MTETIQPFDAAKLRVALVHDWLNGYRGGEKVLHVLCELFPDAEIFTLFYKRGAIHPRIERHRIHASWMNRLPKIHDNYRYLLPLFPAWADGLKLDAYDLVFSTSHCVAKSARARAGAPHVCYCHTPMRYVWDRFEDYFGDKPAPLRAVMGWEAKRLRAWDRRTARRPDRYIANSEFVRGRISKFYGLRAAEIDVIHPPVDLEAFPVASAPAFDPGGNPYLVVSALVPYKRVDDAVAACAGSGRPLTVAGTGPEAGRLREIASRHPAAKIQFTGFVPDGELPGLMRRHRALLFPGVEDFGITPVEATACGLPVIARAEGGVLDSVRDGLNGVLYRRAGPQGLLEGIERFEARGAGRAGFDPELMRRHAEGFDRPRFAEKIRAAVTRALSS
ncbi:MAG TPA: glycosyltransferase [Candidatus Krumholzibacteria bacterium]